MLGTTVGWSPWDSSQQVATLSLRLPRTRPSSPQSPTLKTPKKNRTKRNPSQQPHQKQRRQQQQQISVSTVGVRSGNVADSFGAGAVVAQMLRQAGSRAARRAVEPPHNPLTSPTETLSLRHHCPRRSGRKKRKMRRRMSSRPQRGCSSSRAARRRPERRRLERWCAARDAQFVQRSGWPQRRRVAALALG